MAPDPELLKRIKNLEREFGPLIKARWRRDPDFIFLMMKNAVWKAVTPPNYAHKVAYILRRYVELVSLENWHRLLVYVWSEVLGPIEWKIWTKSDELHTLCKTKGQGLEENDEYTAKALVYQSSALSSPPPVKAELPARYDTAADRLVLLEEPTFGLAEDSPVFPTFDLANSDIDPEAWFQYVVGMLCLYIEKNKVLDNVEGVFDVWKTKIVMKGAGSA